MIPSFENRHSMGGRALPCGGGGSSSSTTSATYNTDARVVGGDGSQNLSLVASNSDVSVIATDHGAVAAGLELGTKAIDASTKNNETLIAAGSNMFEGALNAVSNANDNLSKAYQSGQQPDQTMLKYAGFAVVGLAAVTLLKR